jgi:hypothetical protein
LGTAQLTLKYKLPFKKSNSKLNLLVQKQPGTDGHEYLISVNGKQKEKLKLITDKLFKMSL